MKMEKDERWFPHCIHLGKEKGYSASGHILPCCWADTPDPGFAPLMKEALKIENNASIEDIFQSEEWQEFMHKLTAEPDKAPRTCWKYCGNGRNFRIKEILDI